MSLLPRAQAPQSSSLPPVVPPVVPPPRRSLRGLVRRHAPVIAGCTLVVVAAAAFYTSRLVPVYAAAATVRIYGKQPDAPAQDILFIARATEVKTEMELLNSRALAGAVVDSLAMQLQITSPKRILRRELFGHVVVSPQRVLRSELLGRVAVARGAPAGAYQLVRRSPQLFLLRAAETRDSLGVLPVGVRTAVVGLTLELTPRAARFPILGIQVQPFDVAVDSLLGALSVTRRGRDTDIIEVRFASRDPDLAWQVPNALVRQFIAWRQDAREAETRSTVAFLRTQIDRLGPQLSAREDTLRRFQEATGLVDAPAQAGAAVRRVADLQAQRDALVAERTALLDVLQKADAARDGATAVAYQDLAGFPTFMKNPATAVLLGSLVAAQDRRADLRRRRLPTDDDVAAEDARIRDIEGQLHGLATTYLEAQTHQLGAVDEELDRSSRGLGRIPAGQIHLAQLQRNTNVLETVYTLYQSRLKEAELVEAAEDPSVRPVDVATPPRRPASPRPLVNLALALFAGLSLGGSAAAARELLDRSVHTRADLLVATGLPVLSLVPHARGLKPPRNGRLRSTTAADRQPPLLAPEAYHRLDANLMYALPDRAPKLVVITSATAGEGKSTCAVNLAAAMVRRRQRVLLVDADLHRGTLSRLFGLAAQPGLATVLAGETPVPDVVRLVTLDPDATVAMLPAGKAPAGPSRLLASAQTRAVLEALRAEYDAIIIDTPPVNAVADAALLGAHSDGVILVARAGVTSAEALALAMEQLRSVRAPVLGALLNDVDLRRETSYDPAYEYLRPELEIGRSG